MTTSPEHNPLRDINNARNLPAPTRDHRVAATNQIDAAADHIRKLREALRRCLAALNYSDTTYACQDGYWSEEMRREYDRLATGR